MLNKSNQTRNKRQNKQKLFSQKEIITITDTKLINMKKSQELNGENDPDNNIYNGK